MVIDKAEHQIEVGWVWTAKRLHANWDYTVEALIQEFKSVRRAREKAQKEQAERERREQQRLKFAEVDADKENACPALSYEMVSLSKPPQML